MTKELVAALFSGLVLGSLYALMSMGLALVWGGLRVLNLTQGTLYMLGAYAAVLAGRSGLSPVIGVLLAFVIIGVLGSLLYVGPVRRVSARPDHENAVLLLTFGLATLGEYAALVAFGPQPQSVQTLVHGQFTVVGVAFPWNSIMMIIATIMLLTLLGVVMKWTRFGLASRALAQQADGAQLVGINRHRTSMLIFGISSGLAGVGGVLLSSYYFVTPYIGQNYLLLALIVTILGGLGSMSGTLYAAFLVGLIQAISSLYLGTRWSLPLLFAVIIGVLIVRPTGIAGRVAQERL
ncbi:branched-chain amino acid ABC transporter permease [Planosporangium flavigriseum]|uniref:Branched-chain amino acid ABC transporter permease n=1 Tax=Planosporangium flavigriseum TaxID=373681 RepID=A0A8J3LMT6_9ACTN|nr:branched-chain amino acid ABC transporter permease [Planosporangium flavigriseum]NJC65729.1 branched-chain amino acid ABC transporter permease [Planosporangium flavigriseum]GIG73580.1 branched-chain amino acid ABC transporter permease [Planosporangium flavigriseum]